MSNETARLSSTLGYCSNGLVAIRPDGLQFAMAWMKAIHIYSCSSLRKLTFYTLPYTIIELKALLYSSHQHRSSKYLIWMEAHRDKISLIELETGRSQEISIHPNFEVVSLIWESSEHSEFLLYVYELELYVGAYDEGSQTSYTLKGCTLDTSRKPILSISPNKWHICYPSGQRILVYSTKDWTLIADIDAECCNISPRPIFCSNVTIFVASSSANLWRSIFGCKIVDEPLDWVTSLPVKAMTLSNNQRSLFALKCSHDSEQVAVYDIVRMAVENNIDYMSRCRHTCFVATENFKKTRSLSMQYYREERSVDLSTLKRIADERTQLKYLVSVNTQDTILALFSPRAYHAVWICDLTSGTYHHSNAVVILAEETGKVKELLWHPSSNCLAIVCSSAVLVWTKGGGVTAFVGKQLNFEWLSSWSSPTDLGGILTFKDELGSNHQAYLASFTKIDESGGQVT